MLLLLHHLWNSPPALLGLQWVLLMALLFISFPHDEDDAKSKDGKRDEKP